MTTHIVIPVRDQLHITQSIVEQITQQSGWDKCWIFDNGSVDTTWNYLTGLNGKDLRFWPTKSAGLGIYDMWDAGFNLAKKEGADYVAILNNDLNLFPSTFERLNYAMDSSPEAWIVYPDYNATFEATNYTRVTAGTYRHGGMSGFCFMLRTAPINWDPLVDSRFKWWGGDDDIAFEVERRGGQQIRVMGLPVQHLNEGTARHHDLGIQKDLDMQSIFDKWGR